MDLKPGIQIKDPRGQKYTLVKKLGEGAFGQVWEARAPDRSTVAIKIILSTRASEQEFMDEVNLLKGAKPKNGCALSVVCVRSAWVGPRAFYLVTEFLPGTDLKKYIRNVESGTQRANLNDLLGILDQIVDGVDWIHSRGMVHQDLKPANIQIDTTGKGVPKATILDLGLACFMPGKGEQPACRRTAGGTATYMAPEVWKGNIMYPKKVDIFALGVILFFIATGQRLFDGKDEDEIEYNILNDIHAEIATGHERLDKLILAMTEPNPMNRPDIEQVRAVASSISGRAKFPVLEVQKIPIERLDF